MCSCCVKKQTPQYPPDPNLTGAFPGGPPPVPFEVAEFILTHPEEANRQFKERMQQVRVIWKGL